MKQDKITPVEQVILGERMGNIDSSILIHSMIHILGSKKCREIIDLSWKIEGDVKDQEPFTIEINEPSTSCLTFSPSKDNWVMKLEKKDGVNRILFNRDAYPASTTDDFAKAVIEILENAYLKG